MSGLEQSLLKLLDPERRDWLRRLAVPRYVTPDLLPMLSKAAAAASDLASLPFVERALWDTSGCTWVIADGMRKALLGTWSDAEQPELAHLNDALAAHFEAAAQPLDALLHRLQSGSAATARAELRRRFDAALKDDDVAAAHDLLRLVTEAPADDGPEALRTLAAELAPKLARHARWVREREATRTYFPRAFEADLWSLLSRPGAGPWVAQVHGRGGSGKTMFVHHLLGRRCPAADIPAARVDFDFVANLVTTSDQPWRLLLVIAAQLDEQLRDRPFRDLVSRWQRFDARPLRDRRPADRVDRPESGDPDEQRAADDIRVTFKAVLREKRGDAPTLVALDTLENLIHSDDATVSGIVGELAAVHAAVPGLRLLLAGRLDLATRVPEHAALWASATRTVEVARFSDDEARAYLVGARGLAADDDRVAPIVQKADGNPFKLSMLADMALAPSPPSAAEIAAIDGTELFYLVHRIIDRIADPGVQWLVRWGAIPRVLTREFAREVLWPLLPEQLERKNLDDPASDPTAGMGRGDARYTVPQAAALDFDACWQRLCGYAAGGSWVSEVAGLSETLAFHPEVRDPIRGLLRHHDQRIYHRLSHEAYVYWRARAVATSGAEREHALRGALFQAFEPYDRHPERAAAWRELLAEAGDDAAMRAALAGELLAIELRAQRRDREDLVAPAAELLAEAHTELARALVDEADRQPVMPRLRRHLAISSLSLGERAALEARAWSRAAERDVVSLRAALASAAARPSELAPATRTWVASTLAALDSDLPTLERVAREADGHDGWADAAARLAGEYLRREQLTQARALYERLDDAIGAARCALRLGEIGDAAARLEGVSGDDAELLRAEVHLARFEPERALSVTEPLLSTAVAARARGLRAQAKALLGRSVEVMDEAESAAALRFGVDAAEYVALAKLILLGGGSREANRAFSQALASRAASPLDRARMAIVEAEVMASRERIAAIDTSGLPLSARIEHELATLMIVGVDTRGFTDLVALVREGTSPAHRLILLDGIERLPRPSDPSWAEGLVPLTDIAGDEALRLVLTRAEVLRLAGAASAAEALLRRVERSAREDAARRRIADTLARLGHDASAKLADPALTTTRRALPPRYDKFDLSITCEPSAGPWVRTAATRRALEGPLWPLAGTSTAIPTNAVALFAEAWRAVTLDLGRQVNAWVDRPLPELVIHPGHADHAWVPWQLACTEQESLTSRLGLRCLRRAAGPPGEPLSVPLRTIVRVSKGRPPSAAQTPLRPISPLFARRGYDMEYSDARPTTWDAIAESDATLVHVAGALDERRGGAVVLDLGASPDDATGASHIARRFTDLARTLLIVLDVPWPGSEVEAVRQLFLRERFAWELTQQAPHLHVLAVGPTPRRLTELGEHLLKGRLGEAAGWLQRLDRPAESIEELLSRQGASLWSDAPELRFEVGS